MFFLCIVMLSYTLFAIYAVHVNVTVVLFSFAFLFVFSFSVISMSDLLASIVDDS